MRCTSLALSIAFAVVVVPADIVECKNGDRYNGEVLLVDKVSVKIQNEIAGVLTIPRAKVTTIRFGDGEGAAPVPAKPAAKLDANQEAIARVQQELLAGATPEANQMYQDMVRDLLSGKLSVTDIRSQAQGALKDLKELQQDIGDDDAAALLGSYASILENFLRSTQKTPAVTPSSPAPGQ